MTNFLVISNFLAFYLINYYSNVLVLVSKMNMHNGPCILELVANEVLSEPNHVLLLF